MIHKTSRAGRAAIQEALARVYGDRAPTRFETIERWRDGGADPLDAFDVYASSVRRPHWHYVSYGFTDLDEKESDDLVLSGYGFELSFRVAGPAVASPGATPPIRPMHLMQLIARYVFHSGHPLEVGDVIQLSAGEGAPALTFVVDPELEELRTAYGHVKFLQIVPARGADRAEIIGHVAVRQELDPLLIADLADVMWNGH